MDVLLIFVSKIIAAYGRSNVVSALTCHLEVLSSKATEELNALSDNDTWCLARSPLQPLARAGCKGRGKKVKAFIYSSTKKLF